MLLVLLVDCKLKYMYVVLLFFAFIQNTKTNIGNYLKIGKYKTSNTEKITINPYTAQ